jgi:hypothetical protein
MEDIEVVSSHEQVSLLSILTLEVCNRRGTELIIQALGQSWTFLNTHLPSAKRVAVASTALAAESLLSPISSGERAGEGERAAICSKSVIEIYEELEVLYEGTQDRSGMSPLSLLRLSRTLRKGRSELTIQII